MQDDEQRAAVPRGERTTRNLAEKNTVIQVKNNAA